MRVCILISSYERSQSELRDLDPYPNPTPYLQGHDVEQHFIHQATATEQLEALAKLGFDVFINLCDGTTTEDVAGIEVAKTLERLGVPFTGSRSECWDPTRFEMKQACQSAGIDTPKWVITTNVLDANKIAEELSFPMIVKHPHGYSSIALTRASRVQTVDELAEQLEVMIQAYGSALIEEFIEGREFTVLVTEPGGTETEPRAYLPIEIRFPEGETFKHFSLKWVDFAGMEWIAVTDESLSQTLMEIAQKFFVALRCSGYARCDVRLDRHNKPYVLEMNPNCGVFYDRELFGSADFIIDRAAGGHLAFMQHLIECALKRTLKA